MNKKSYHAESPESCCDTLPDALPKMPFNIEHIHVFKSCAIVNLSALLHIWFHVLPIQLSLLTWRFSSLHQLCVCTDSPPSPFPFKSPYLPISLLSPLCSNPFMLLRKYFSPPPLLPPSSSSSLQPSPGAAALSQLALLGAGLPSMHHSQASEHSQWAYILLAQWTAVFGDHVLSVFWERVCKVNNSLPGYERRVFLWQETFPFLQCTSTIWVPSFSPIMWNCAPWENTTRKSQNLRTFSVPPGHLWGSFF